MNDAFTEMGGSLAPENRRNITKKSFIVFINALNNIHLGWMAENSC